MYTYISRDLAGFLAVDQLLMINYEHIGRKLSDDANR